MAIAGKLKNTAFFLIYFAVCPGTQDKAFCILNVGYI